MDYTQVSSALYSPLHRYREIGRIPQTGKKASESLPPKKKKKNQGIMVCATQEA
jgi:hypothetical protein